MGYAGGADRISAQQQLRRNHLQTPQPALLCFGRATYCKALLINRLIAFRIDYPLVDPVNGREQRVRVSLACCTLPDYQDPPSLRPKFRYLAQIPCAIAFNFVQPKFCSGTGYFEIAARMAMPEASVNEHNRAKPRKCHVRAAGKTGRMETITKTLGVQRPANDEFWSCVCAFDSSHHPTSGRPIDFVNQQLSFLSGEAPIGCCRLQRTVPLISLCVP